jgi:CheY-like chemotaxis protein
MPTVLVVDDDDDVREALRDLLERRGFGVAEAADGSEALACLRDVERQPCVVLLDLMMPVLNGWELLDILQKDDRLRTIPVTVVSAQSAPSLPAGVRVLRKPVSAEAVIAAVVAVCGYP